MEANILLSPINVDVLLDKLTSRFAEIIELKQKSELAEKLLSPAETCKLFQPNISKVTLHKWTKDGRLQEHRIGSRVFYKYSEVLASLQTLKKYQKA
jgi:hypothetical protein